MSARARALYQTHVLSERYLDVFLADWTSLFFLAITPIGVAVCAGLVWQGQAATPQLHFVLVFSAMFFGCVNACREIVKERPIFQRERLVGLRIGPYVASKFGVLAMLGFGQILVFYLCLRFFLILDGSPLLMGLTLYLSLLAGTSLGLVISALATTDVMALALVPVCLIPQLLFSKMVLPARQLTGPVAWLEKSTLVKWSYQAMEQVVAQPVGWGELTGGLACLVGLTAGLVLLSAGLLSLRDGA